MVTARARYLGLGLIAATWVVSAYLVTYYAILLYFGPHRLCAALGSKVYNAVFPNGGFLLLLWAALVAVVWALPLGFFFAMLSGVMRCMGPKTGQPWRLRGAGIGAVLLTAALHFGSLDGWPWVAFPYLRGDDTEFAPAYSAFGFWSIRPGLTPEEVIARVGEPLERYPISGRPDEEGWRWTRSPNSGDYRVRVVIFRKGGVVERFSEYYLD